MPISNTKAFGGLKFADNPVGIGFWQKGIQADKYPLPCITYPGTEMDEPQDVITPAYFSPIDQMSSDRQQYAGTYDEVWMETDIRVFLKILIFYLIKPHRMINVGKDTSTAERHFTLKICIRIIRFKGSHFLVFEAEFF